jgi:hypothetical protein
MTWNERFLHLFDRCAALYQNGNHDFETYYPPEDRSFLNSIGYKPREFFDFVEDFCEDGAPSAASGPLKAPTGLRQIHRRAPGMLMRRLVNQGPHHLILVIEIARRMAARLLAGWVAKRRGRTRSATARSATRSASTPATAATPASSTSPTACSNAGSRTIPHSPASARWCSTNSTNAGSPWMSRSAAASTSRTPPAPTCGWS